MSFLLFGCAITQKAGVEFKPELAENKLQKEFDTIQKELELAQCDNISIIININFIVLRQFRLTNFYNKRKKKL